MEKSLIHQAQEILEDNEQIIDLEDRNGHTQKIRVRPPDREYYEGSWLWDTGFNELSGSGEIFSNFLKFSQWKNGFVPHILFYKKEQERYFPGSKYWQTENSENAPLAYTSGITQPPVLGFCAFRIYKRLKEKSPDKAQDFLKETYPRILNFHRYLFQNRDQEGSGLVSIYHPWEAGLDNSPRWEECLSRISVTQEQLAGTRELRKDVKGLVAKLVGEGMREEGVRKLASEMRPTNEDYARYLYLMRFLADKNYDDRKIYAEVPFNIKDVLFNSVLYASNEALYLMAHEMRDEKSKAEIKGYLSKQRAVFGKLYDGETGLYYDLDNRTSKLIKRKTIASFAPLFAGMATPEQAKEMAKIARGKEFKGDSQLFLIPSTARTDPSFYPKAYWRGPVWMPTNWLVARGFERMGLSKEAEEIKNSLLQLVEKSGFNEYYDSDTNKGLGRDDFSWTASLIIDLAKDPHFWQKLWRVG